MPLKTVVKIGSITNLSDARYCAGMGVDFLGFRVINGQRNYLPSKKYQEISGWVTGPQTVAELYGMQHPHELDAILEGYKPDYLEMGLTELNLFSTLPLPIILFLDGAIPSTLPVEPNYLLLKQIIENQYSFPVLLEVHSLEEMNTALRYPSVGGIALQGSSEISPGLKDYALLADILEQLESD
jgi:phosphoribosylanthranilate isomerase